tara:strand:+ start:411 stop:665 length:255 start_codon:yes stop_codon:yes gene_type:complete
MTSPYYNQIDSFSSQDDLTLTGDDGDFTVENNYNSTIVRNGDEFWRVPLQPLELIYKLQKDKIIMNDQYCSGFILRRFLEQYKG